MLKDVRAQKFPRTDFFKTLTAAAFIQRKDLASSGLLVNDEKRGWGGGRGRNSHMELTGMLVGILNLTLKETIWAWLKLFLTPKRDQSGRGLSKF